MNLARIFILLSVLLLTGCISNAFPDQAAVSPTIEAIATRTPSPVPSATPTPTTEPTPTQTEMPVPPFPEDVINNSWGILDENSFIEIDGEYVLVRKVESEEEQGDIIFRWDPRTGWRAVRSFWECGKSLLPGTYAPTGLLRKEEEILGTHQLQARACLVEVDGYQDPTNPDHVLEGKLLFYDNQKNSHVINFKSGGISTNGFVIKGGIAKRINHDHVYKLLERNDLALALRDYLEEGVRTTRQVDVIILTGSDIERLSYLDNHMEEYRELNEQIVNAIRTGRNFPVVPKNYFLYVLEFDITPLPWSLVPRTR
jgi:hypothetical protein